MNGNTSIHQVPASHLNRHDLDIRKSVDTRFMDQKVTPDVLCFIADCVMNYIGTDFRKEFTVRDIWNSPYLIKNIPAIFGKPSPKDKYARSEYDKFVAQPIKTLSYAKVLSARTGQTHRQIFIVANRALLEFIALSERNSRIFLYEYIVKVLTDSGFIVHFNELEKLHRAGQLTQERFLSFKKRFQQFMLGHTKIRGITEINRILPKVINPLCVEHSMKGVEKGRLSKDIFLYPDLMYNRLNFRDLYKSKGKTRKETRLSSNGVKITSTKFKKYRMSKAMEYIKRKYMISEVEDEWARGPATHVHHIFPRAEFPELADYLENLIKLTATQHCERAHPRGSTTRICEDYQLKCLLAKIKSIEVSLKCGEFCYSKASFIQVVNTGLKLDLAIDADFKEIRLAIIRHYSK